MVAAFDYSPDRPENIDTILNGLDRYNPETTTIFQEYVAQQCENQTYDCYANLALLKLYVPTLSCNARHTPRRRRSFEDDQINVSYYLTGPTSPSDVESILALSDNHCALSSLQKQSPQ